jgi:TMEM199 family protein
MVVLTMTGSIVEAIKRLDEHLEGQAQNDAQTVTEASATEPSLKDPAVGKPVSHSQIIELWKRVNSEAEADFTLEKLLQGARVYVPPPSPKPEPVGG